MKRHIERLEGFVKKTNSSRRLSLLAILVLIAAIPFTVFLAGQQQQTQQKAASCGYSGSGDCFCDDTPGEIQNWCRCEPDHPDCSGDGDDGGNNDCDVVESYNECGGNTECSPEEGHLYKVTKYRSSDCDDAEHGQYSCEDKGESSQCGGGDDSGDDGDEGGDSCDIGGQSPGLSDKYVSCFKSSRYGDLVESIRRLDRDKFSPCDDKEVLTYWCNKVGQSDCATKKGECDNAVSCRDNPPETNPPSGYLWKADCSDSCQDFDNHTDCPKNNFDLSNVNPDTSRWCYGFSNGGRCLKLMRTVCQKPTDSACAPATPTPTRTPTPRPGTSSTSSTGSTSGSGGSTSGTSSSGGNTSTGSNTSSSSTGGSTTGGNPTPTPTRTPTPGPGTPTATPTPRPGTPTPTQIPGPGTPTPTLAPNGMVLVMTFQLEGIGLLDNRSPKHPTKPFAVTFTNSDNEEAGVGNGLMTYNSVTGIFKSTLNMQNAPPGDYLVKVKIPGYLGKVITNILTITSSNKNYTLPQVTITPGDINDDNVVDILDYNSLVACFGNKQTTATCSSKEKADLNDDGRTDGIDVNLFIRSLSVRQGD